MQVPVTARRGSRVVQIVRGFAEDDGARLALGVALVLSGPQLVEVAASALVRAGLLRRGR